MDFRCAFTIDSYRWKQMLFKTDGIKFHRRSRPAMSYRLKTFTFRSWFFARAYSLEYSYSRPSSLRLSPTVSSGLILSVRFLNSSFSFIVRLAFLHLSRRSMSECYPIQGSQFLHQKFLTLEILLVSLLTSLLHFSSLHSNFESASGGWTSLRADSFSQERDAAPCSTQFRSFCPWWFFSGFDWPGEVFGWYDCSSQRAWPQNYL